MAAPGFAALNAGYALRLFDCDLSARRITIAYPEKSTGFFGQDHASRFKLGACTPPIRARLMSAMPVTVARKRTSRDFRVAPSKRLMHRSKSVPIFAVSDEPLDSCGRLLEMLGILGVSWVRKGVS